MFHCCLQVTFRRILTLPSSTCLTKIQSFSYSSQSSDPPSAPNGKGLEKFLKKYQHKVENIKPEAGQQANTQHQYLEPLSLKDLPPAPKEVSFAHMFRHSPLVHLGDFADKKVVGTIYEVINNDLYINFGGKFHCVCPRPSVNGQKFNRGSKVILRLNDLEMTSQFLADVKAVTLLEADATLLGLDDSKQEAPQKQ